MTEAVATQFSWIRQLPDGRLQLVDDKDWARQIVHNIKKVVATCRSHRGQEIAILDLERFGPTLVINGWIQFAMLDEHRYHQTLVLPALYSHPQPEDVLILGGGDYLAAHRVLMHRGVKRIKVADWDMTVPRLVLEHTPKIRQLGVHKDPRVDFNVETDVAQYLPDAPNASFDVIFEDLTEVGTLEQIVPEALIHLHRLLKPGGVLVAQAGELTLAAKPLEALAATVKRMGELFHIVWVFGVAIDSFSYTQVFLAAWRNLTVTKAPTAMTQEGFWDRFDTSFYCDPEFFDLDTYKALFTLDPTIKKALRL